MYQNQFVNNRNTFTPTSNLTSNAYPMYSQANYSYPVATEPGITSSLNAGEDDERFGLLAPLLVGGIAGGLVAGATRPGYGYPVGYPAPYPVAYPNVPCCGPYYR